MHHKKLHKLLLDGTSKDDLMRKAFESSKSYLNTASRRNPYPGHDAIEVAKNNFKNLPGHPTPPSEVIGELIDVYSPATVATHNGRYFGFVIGSTLPVSLAANWISSAWDQNSSIHVLSPASSFLETQVEAWVVEALGFPGGTCVGLVSSTSQSLLAGIVTARNTLLARKGWDVHQMGLRGSPPIKVVVGEQAHATVYRALSIAGIGKQDVTVIPADQHGRMRPESVEELDDTTLLILQAGNINTGAFDQYEELVTRANHAGSWVHIDGAFGLWAAASPKFNDLTRGIEKADSWSADCHKTLNTPFECGLILCRERRHLADAMRASGDYITFSEERDGMNYSPDMARRCRAAEVWAALRCLGKSGLAELVECLCEGARKIAKGLAQQEFNVLNQVFFNQIVVAMKTDDETVALMEHIQQEGLIWCGEGMWQGQKVIRISVCSWLTTDEDIHTAVDTFCRAREAIR